MNARHAPWTDSTGGAMVDDSLASVLPLPLLDAVDTTARLEALSSDDVALGEDVTLLLLAEHHHPGAGYFTRALGINGGMSVAEDRARRTDLLQLAGSDGDAGGTGRCRRVGTSGELVTAGAAQ
jgi:hypothetical protein